MSHFLYLVRHGEQQDAHHGLADGPLPERGKRQARAIAERLGGVPFTNAWHSPLQRAEDTASIMMEFMPALDSRPSSLLMDCVPSGPPPELPHAFQPFFGSVSQDQIDAGQAQMADAVDTFMTPGRGDRHDLLVTHNFVIAWFVREVFDAAPWRWLGLNQAHCGLTIIRLWTAKPSVLVTHNDLGHLPVELRTGIPEVQPF